jgi:hypothetical protein
MFGCHLIYLGNRMMLLLRQRPKEPQLNGVYVATLPEHHDSLLATLGLGERPRLFTKNDKKEWLFLPEEHAGFESAALTACQLIKKADKRIGKEKRNK